MDDEARARANGWRPWRPHNSYACRRIIVRGDAHTSRWLNRIEAKPGASLRDYLYTYTYIYANSWQLALAFDELRDRINADPEDYPIQKRKT